MTRVLSGLALLLAACSNPPDLGDPCTTDDDCAPDYVCHLEPGEAEGVCDACHHDDPDCAHEDHEEESSR